MRRVALNLVSPLFVAAARGSGELSVVATSRDVAGHFSEGAIRRLLRPTAFPTAPIQSLQCPGERERERERERGAYCG